MPHLTFAGYGSSSSSQLNAEIARAVVAGPLAARLGMGAGQEERAAVGAAR